MFQALAGGQESLLRHVVRPQPPPQRLGQAEVNDLPQAVPLAGKHLGQRLKITAPEAALKLFREEPPDLVVTDMALPGVGGLEIRDFIHVFLGKDVMAAADAQVKT